MNCGVKDIAAGVVVVATRLMSIALLRLCVKPPERVDGTAAGGRILRG
jgi:hypothetical protein